jgi:hypothetical protein
VDPFYAVVRLIARFWIWFFFERVEVRHPERVPRAGPVLLCINHPNNLIDSLLVGSVLPRKVHYLAAAVLFRNPLLARLLAALGVMAVHRRADGPDNVGRNVEMFAACDEAFDRTVDPERVERLWQRMLGYHAGLAAYRLGDEAVRTRLERTAERQRVATSWQTIVGLPLFAYGAAVNFLPYYLPGWLAGRLSRRQTDYATTRLLASVVAFPLFWALETSLVGWAAGLRWLLVFSLSLPLGGLIAYRYVVGTGRLRHQLRFGALLLTRAQEARRLLAERRQIVEELERATRDYLGTNGGVR